MSKESSVAPNVSKLGARTVANQSAEERTNVVSTLWHRVQAKMLFPHIRVSPHAVETLSHADTMKQLMAQFEPSLLLEKLTKIYGQEELMHALVHVIHSTNGLPSTKTFASMLLDKQLGQYVDKDLDLAAFFKVVHLRPALASLTNEKMAIVQRFHELVNEKYGRDVSFLDAVASVFGGLKTLTGIVHRAKFDVEVKPLALRVEQAMINDWLAKNLHPERVLQKLELDKSVDALRSDALATGLEYIRAYNEKHPNNMFALVDEFTKKFGHKAVASALLEAQNVRTTRNVAKALLTLQFKTWRQHQVVDLLELKNNGELFLEGPTGQLLKAYVAFYNHEYRPHTRLDEFSVLLKGFGDAEFARRLALAIHAAKVNDKGKYVALEKLLFQKWRNENVKPSMVPSKYLGNIDKSAEAEFLKRYEASYRQKKVRFTNT
ncbi:hypothetical protein PsorP6_003172 [Peronosclerospora sorghi]|uniref:Uncharacterized protein n=1 Tax=Peronosclerospora sorghi TaxID=230839 RepID=A0ACC0VQA6_9STRA|nr:hypothetical protein PsorP6_003172 [Peronosclerospora sorghi]